LRRTHHSAGSTHRRVPLGHAAVRRAGGAAARRPDASTTGTMTARAFALMAAIITSITAAEASSLSAQSMRDFSAARQRHGANRLIVRLDFAAGSVDLRPGRGDDLYRYDVRYDADRFSPLVDFDASASSVALGLRNVGGGG